MADSPLQSIEACEGGRRVTQKGNKITSLGEMAQPPKRQSPSEPDAFCNPSQGDWLYTTAPTTTQAKKYLEGPQWNTVNNCKRQEGNVQTKNICRTFGNQNWRNSKLHR